MATQHSTDTQSKPLQAEKADYIKTLLNQHIGDTTDFIDSGAGVGKYLEFLAKDDKDGLSSISKSVVDIVFTSISAVGKMIAYSDVKEIGVSQRDIGWLLVTLSDLGLNAAIHGNQASGIINEVKNL